MSVAESKTKALLDQGFAQTGVMLRKEDKACIVTDMGRVEWFQVNPWGGVHALSAAPAAPAVPAGWKAVPVNPTPEMWKAAKTVPDPNPPYPPHYGLVWDAMLAASPTPPAEQQAAPKAAPGEPMASAAKGAIMGAAYDFRDAHISGSMNLKRSAHAALEDAVDNALAAQSAPQQEAQSYSEKWDAELGRTAMRFVDRAGDVHPGIDDAATICAEFHKAMSEVIERMPHVQRMAAPKAAHQPAPAPLSDDAKDAARYRWLIDQHWIQTEVDWRLISTHQDSTIRQLDAAIDAALAAQGGKA